jgi:WD40 repeat protein/tetratricopeptide (TPR) repeat protein
MTQLSALDRNTANNQKSLDSLVRAISMSKGQFKLILLRCNYIKLRHKMLKKLRELCSIKIREIDLNKSTKQLHSTIREKLGEEQPEALMVLGLELVIDIDELLISLNQVREELSKNFQFPLILWVNDKIVNKLIRLAPDLENWTTIFEFTSSDDELLNIIKTITDNIFDKVLDAGAGKFLNISAALNLESGSPHRIELELARKEINSRKINLESELEASLEFVLGLAKDDSLKESWEHYQRSLELWQPNTNSIRRGCVLYYQGRWYRTFASRHPHLTEKVYPHQNLAEEVDKDACDRAKTYCQESIRIFDQSNRSDLVAKFINTLGEVLQRLQNWNELEKIAKKTIDLYPAYSEDKFRLARAYGFLAQVELNLNQNWSKTQEYARKALDTFKEAESHENNNLDIERLEWECSYHQGWYLLPLAQEQHHRGQIKDAIKTLEDARKITNPQYDAKLYIKILEELRSLYKNQKKYLEAFKIKQEQKTVEQQYGLRFFVGVGRLQSGKTINNPALQALPSIEKKEKVAREISVSERQKDLDKLVERMGRPDYKLTVVYGQSGVGKSSLLQAGLIPVLRQKGINNCEVLPIIIQSKYNNWIEEISNKLKAECLKNEYLKKNEHNICSTESTFSEENILGQLKKNAEYNLLTVIVFDEFEEFLSINKKINDDKKLLFNFLNNSLDIPNVKIIISLREDCLNYLLEIPRLIDANENSLLDRILDKNVLYYIGNFSIEEAKSSIQRLNKAIDQTLLDRLVENLAEGTGEISPIELQVIGVQLETELKINKDGIESLLEGDSKNKLIDLYLEEVIQDCGSENEGITRLVLYLLTDENNTRLIKTGSELKADFNRSDRESLDLILNILVNAGLIFEVSSSASKQYQLSHDYLVSLIRKSKKNQPGFTIELNQTRQELREALQKIAIDEIKALNQLAELLWRSHDQLGALLASLKAAKKLKEITTTEEDLKSKTARVLGHIVYRIQEYNRFEGHSHAVNSICFISSYDDREMLISASADHKIKLWGFEGEELKTLGEHPSEVNSISFNYNNKLLASASADGTIKIWDLHGQELSNFQGHQTFINSICFSPNGQLLASASADKTIKIWNLNGKYPKTFRRCIRHDNSLNRDNSVSHDSFINSVSFSPKGDKIASAGADGWVKLWSVKDGSELLGEDFYVGKNVEVNSVNFSPDGSKIASANADCSLWWLDVSQNQQKILKCHRSHVKDVSFSPDNRHIVSVSADGILKLWSLDGKELQSVKAHNDEILSVCFSADSQIVASASADNIVKLWKLESRELKTFSGHGELVNQVCVSPKGVIASASEDGTVKLWDMNGKELATCKGHNSFVNSVCFSRDGKTIASASSDRTIRIWNLHGEQRKYWEAHQTWVNSVCFSPDRTKIASGSADGEIKIWDPYGTRFSSFGHERTVKSICFNPDGTKIASASTDRTVKLWTVEGQLMKTFEGHKDWVRSVCFSHDGTKIASASNDQTIKLWNLEGHLLQTFTGHNSQVNSVFFSPDDKTIISTSADGTVKWWDLQGNELKTLPAYSECRSLCVSPDGEKIVLGNSDGTLTLFNSDLKFDLDDLLVQGCNWIRDYLKHNRNVSESDRSLCDGIIC